MNKRFTSLGLTAALVAGGAAGLALGITRIAGATGQEPVVAVSEAAATPVTTPTSTVAGDTHDHKHDDTHDDKHDGKHGRGGHRGGLDSAATALGMTSDELFAALETDQTIAALAESKSIDPQTVIDAIIASITAHEQEEVVAGEHTQAEVDARLADLSAHVTAMVNGTLDLHDGRRSHGPHGNGHHGDHNKGDHNKGDHNKGDHNKGDHEDGDRDG